ncbi:MAG: cyclic nucleotide-binding domain-containing protein [Myxococcaceae bacterium]|nr:cyclic nucleotide-binding domain-containing protein [Myxococcaceae bacterium]
MARSWARRLGPAAAFQFCFIGAVAMLKPATNALVLSRFQSSAMPWLYLGASILTGALALLGAQAGRRRRSPDWLALLGGVIALGFLVAVKFEVPLTPLAAYLFAEAFATQVSLAFWGTVGEAFDAREARRAFTWINGVGMSGAIAGGFLAQVAARLAGAPALLSGGGVLLLLAFVAFRFHEADEVTPPPARTGLASVRTVAELPYARLLALLVLGFSVVQQLTDFVFRQRAEALLGEADMAHVFAAHQLWTGVFCVVFQFVAAESLLRRLGILRYVALVPGLLALLTVVTWAWPSVWGAWALKLFESAASWSLLPVAVQLLYAPLPDDVRDGVRRSVDGLVRKAGMGVAGVLLIGLSAAFGLTGVLVSVLAVCAGVGLVLWRIRPRYLDALHVRVAGVESTSLVGAELQLLSEALSTPAPERALRAADLLEYAGAIDESHVRSLVAHPNERVQTRGVKLAERVGATGVTRQLEALATSGARRPREAAMWALARLAPERARVVLPPLLDSRDVGVVTSAVGGLLSLRGPPHEKARSTFAQLVERSTARPVSERREVARLVGRLGDPEHAAILGRSLEDADGTVRQVAIVAAGEGLFLELAPRLLRFLSWRDERRFARDALAAMGDDVVPLLAATLDDRSRGLSLRMQLPRVLRRIGTQTAFDALLDSNARDDAALHYRVGAALTRIRDEHPAFTVNRARVLEALARRRETRAQLLPAWRSIRAALGDASLLTRIIGDRLAQAFELSLWLLGLLHESRALRRAHAHLVGADQKRRAFALELIDNLLTDEERAQIADELDAPHGAQPLGDDEAAPAFVEELCSSDDFTLRACARRVGRQMGVWGKPPKEDDMSDATVKRLFALEGVEIFAQSDVDDLAAVAQVAKEQSYRRGERIYAEGDPGDALYVIVTGAVEARRDDEVVMTMKARESFGETSLFDGAPRINEVIALADTAVLVIDRRDFLDLLGDRPELLAGMFRVMSRQLKTMVVEVAARRANTGDLPAVSMPPVTETDRNVF